MTDHGDICSAAGTIAEAAVQSNFRRTAIDADRRLLEPIHIDSTEARDLFRSANPNISVGERIVSQHDRFDHATANRTPAATDAIETTRRLGNIGLSLLARRPSDLVRSVQKVA
ncbi:hypothetical protein H8A97_28345 [Bradyrhizobium sp. Arg62]|uniref:hypothetical protein n=1 Tax=Bradyrhizobium TaxID=374 RepID=UPI001E642E67|nr:MULTISPECIES: hypothetical protein [Bradyrhizobium]MCC8939689.1 hypothetical protein [Bradyrhizobium ivorense]MCC8948909.1 hypothetical protein [Bradyrhizobium brasilense]